MAKGETITKPSKEQKGKHSVLVIAIGKHPKMGPGPRKSKSLKKEDEDKPRKSKSQARREKRARRAEKRAERGETKESEAQKGTEESAALQMKRLFTAPKGAGKHAMHGFLHAQRIPWSHLMSHMGKTQEQLETGDYDAQDLFDSMNAVSDKSKQVQESRQPQSMTDYQEKFRTGMAPHRETSFRSKKEADMDLTLHRLTQQLERMGVDMSNIKLRDHLEGDEFKSLRDKIPLDEAFAALGKEGSESREFNRLAAAQRRIGRKSGGGQKIRLDKNTTGWQSKDDDPRYGKWVDINELDTIQEELQGGDNEDKDAQRLQRLMMGRSHQGSPQDLADWAREEGRFEHDPAEGQGDLFREPGGGTTPFATTMGTGLKRNPGTTASRREKGRGAEHGVEESMHGFAPMPSAGLARVGDQPGQIDEDEEANMDAVQDRMTELQRGNPMDLAFRLLKNAMCKGDETCQCPKCCENDEDIDNQFMRMCDSCGRMLSPTDERTHMC